jgi:hypothetical protein
MDDDRRARQFGAAAMDDDRRVLSPAQPSRAPPMGGGWEDAASPTLSSLPLPSTRPLSLSLSNGCTRHPLPLSLSHALSRSLCLCSQEADVTRAAVLTPRESPWSSQLASSKHHRKSICKSFSVSLCVSLCVLESYFLFI